MSISLTYIWYKWNAKEYANVYLSVTQTPNLREIFKSAWGQWVLVFGVLPQRNP